MDATVIWNRAMSFTGTAGTGFQVPLDSDPSTGGENSGFRPMELLAIALASCTAMDVISILRKKQQDVTGFEVQVHAEQAADHPHVFTSILIEYIVTGNKVDPKAVERSIELSTTRYCAVHAMISNSTEIKTSYRVLETVGGGPA